MGLLGLGALGGIIGWALWLVVVAVPAYEILRSNTSANWKLGWILVVLALPVLGTVIYYAAGRKSGK